jgi:hypothetical protein
LVLAGAPYFDAPQFREEIHKAPGESGDPRTDGALYDIARDVPSRFTFNDAEENDPVWSPDGSMLAFSSRRDGPYTIYLKNANGSAQEGFSFGGTRLVRDHYEFTTLRLTELIDVFGPHAIRGTLTELAVYHSVFTTLHALTWTDMSFFSEPDRHGDPTRPYRRKRIPFGVIGAVLTLGFVPELLAVVGFMVTIRRRSFQPLAIVCAVAVAAYVWWFVSQESWALKTKYLLFLLPPFVVYTVTGLAFLWNRAPRLGAAAALLMAALIVATHLYLIAFAIA